MPPPVPPLLLRHADVVIGSFDAANHSLVAAARQSPFASLLSPRRHPSFFCLPQFPCRCSFVRRYSLAANRSPLFETLR
ncbi:hypothetical protein U1Q18_015317 [Sarracenia purpurea var. burkii]